MSIFYQGDESTIRAKKVNLFLKQQCESYFMPQANWNWISIIFLKFI